MVAGGAVMAVPSARVGWSAAYAGRFESSWGKVPPDDGRDQLVRKPTGVHDHLSDIAQLDVPVLGVPAEHFERAVLVKVVTLHQHALGLTDQLSSVDGSPQVLRLPDP